MKQGACLAYSHGFNIVEGQVIRPDITVIMVAPKCPGTEVREEYKRGFVPTLIAVHPKSPTAMVWRSLKHMPRNGRRSSRRLKVIICSRGETDLMANKPFCAECCRQVALCFDKMIEKGDAGFAAS